MTDCAQMCGHASNDRLYRNECSVKEPWSCFEWQTIHKWMFRKRARNVQNVCLSFHETHSLNDRLYTNECSVKERYNQWLFCRNTHPYTNVMSLFEWDWAHGGSFYQRDTDYRALLWKIEITGTNKENYWYKWGIPCIFPHYLNNFGCARRSTGWRRCIGYLKLQVSFRKRATNCRALLLKIACKNKEFYASALIVWIILDAHVDLQGGEDV